MTERIFTIGHSTHPIDEFVRLLTAHGVEQVIDVRTIAKSRHSPQFCEDELSESLPASGIVYGRLEALGGLRHTVKDSPNGAWRSASFRGYADYMQTPAFTAGLDELIELVARATVAIMCAEAVPWRCGATTKGVTLELSAQVDYLRHKNGAVRGGVAGGRPLLKRDVHVCEAILAMSGTTNGHLATQGFKTLEKRTGVRLADLAEEHKGKQITFADTQGPPVPVITSPEWSGSETGGRRYSPFTINVERKKPWHTLTGRMHFYLDHDWMTELGEGLPVYRPPLNMAALFAEPALGNVSDGSTIDGVEQVEGLTVRFLTPHNKWSIHSEYQDNLFMLSLSRGGQNIWMSDKDAEKVGIKDNDWIEAVNRNGVVVARAIVSHRMPEGTVYMYHAQDRLIDVPLAETSGKRGGIHNSLTRILVKPSHLIGGYAQLSFAFNYLGPTGNQRDEVTVIRRRSQDVEY